MVYSGDHVDISVCITKDELVRLWEEHTAHEFATREPAATWETMVKDAYGNHIPVLTGGYGKPALAEFSTERFVPNMPPHTIETPVWRTVGEDQLVAAMIYSFTHTQEMPWMLPGGADRETGGGAAGGDCYASRRDTGARTYRLGPGIDTEADWVVDR